MQAVAIYTPGHTPACMVHVMGDAAFDATMSDYYVAQSYRLASTDAFFDAVARHTDRDVSLLVRNYFENPPKLPCKISANAPDCRKLS